MEQEQEWLHRRLAGLSAASFEGKISVYSVGNLTPPEAFKESWATFRVDDERPPSDWELAELKAIVIFGNPFDEKQRSQLFKLVTVFDLVGHEAPPMLWCPHTVAPEMRTHDQVLDVKTHSLVSELLDLGLDCIISGEPEGLRLPLAICAKLRQLTRMANTVNNAIDDRRAVCEQAAYLKECIHSVLWDYARVRLAPVIPPVDYNLPAGEIVQVGQMYRGDLLGQGAIGRVYSLSASGTLSAGGCEGERLSGSTTSDVGALKVVDKSTRTELSDVLEMRAAVEVFQLLSKEEWRHPNIIELYEVHHSLSYISFRMGHGGPENLYERLLAREQGGSSRRPLSCSMVASLVQQALMAIEHLHLGPMVCHRDLKPENFLVNAVSDQLTLRLCDFDLSMICKTPTMFRTICGTMPFTAPEVLLEPEYDAMVADIWSLGIVLFEVLSRVAIISQLLFLERGAREERPRVTDLHDVSLPGREEAAKIEMPRKIQDLFRRRGAARRMLQDYIRPELYPLLRTCQPLMEGMLSVSVDQRWKADRLFDPIARMEQLEVETTATP